MTDRGTDWDGLARRHPEAFEALAGVLAAAWEESDPSLLEMARLRIATLLRNAAELDRRNPGAGVPEEKLATLPSWPTSELFSPRERACLAFTEQFVIDANGVTDEVVAGVTEHLGPEGCYVFAQAVSVLETFQRACLTLGIESVPTLEEIAATAANAATEG